MKVKAPSNPVRNHTPTTAPMIITGTVSATTKAKSAAIRPNSNARRFTGVITNRSKYPLCMSVTTVMALEIPVTANSTATGSWNAL